MMELCFLGTGAADWDWRDYPLGTRGSTMTLVNGRLLLDAGPSLERNFALAGRERSAVEALLITHSHSDHFNPDMIAALAQNHPLDIYAAPQALERLDMPTLRRHPIRIGDQFDVCGIHVTALPANHCLDNYREQAFHFLLEEGAKRVLYQLDGAWFTSVEKQLLGKGHLDAIVWDATVGISYHNWRFADHNDLAMINEMRIAMAKVGMIDDSTRHFYNHIARTLWPENADARQDLARKFQGELLEDNMHVTVG